MPELTPGSRTTVQPPASTTDTPRPAAYVGRFVLDETDPRTTPPVETGVWYSRKPAEAGSGQQLTMSTLGPVSDHTLGRVSDLVLGPVFACTPAGADRAPLEPARRVFYDRKPAEAGSAGIPRDNNIEPRIASQHWRSLRTVLLAFGVALGLMFALQAVVSVADARTLTPALSQRERGAAQEGTNYADVVVDFGDGRIEVRRVMFVSPTISSLEALQLSGIDAGIADFDFGAAICSIGKVGCSLDNCFCDPNQYWGLFRLQDGQWAASQVGAADSVVKPGDVDGWHWGPFESTPPAISREELAALAGLQWLRGQQSADGSFGGNVGATLDTVLAGAAAGENMARWRGADGKTPWDFLRKEAGKFATRDESRASAGKLALMVAAAGLDPRSFAGQNLVVSMSQVYSPTTGAFGESNWDQAFNMLGWRAASETVPVTATALLVQRMNEDGGWGWTASSESDVDTSALAVQALLAAGEPVTSTAVVSGLAYIQAAQNDDGGFPYLPTSPTDTSSNSNSTAFVVQAILAAGQDPLDWTTGISATTPISFLLGQQTPDGGFAFTTPPANDFAARQAVPALLGKTMIVHSKPVARRATLAWIASQQQPDGSFAGFNPGATADAVLAIVAAGRNPTSYRSADGLSALDYLAAEASGYAEQGASAAGKLALAVAAAGQDPRDFGGIDLTKAISATYAITNGQFGAGNSVWDQSWAMLGLQAVGETVPVSATEALEAMQAESGGWGFDASAEPDADSSALALQALAAVGRTAEAPSVQAGLDWLRSIQSSDGGWPGYDGATSASSTGLALQALAAVGQSPTSPQWTGVISGTDSVSRLVHATALDALLALQSPDGGFAGFSGANDPFSTYQALPGILAKSYGALARQHARVQQSQPMTPQTECTDRFPWAKLTSFASVCTGQL